MRRPINRGDAIPADETIVERLISHVEPGPHSRSNIFKPQI
jgi:hypothetical protein